MKLSQIILICLIEGITISISFPQYKRNPRQQPQQAWHFFSPNVNANSTRVADPVPKSIDSSSTSAKCQSNPLMNYRYDNDARKCGTVGRQEHCGKNMIFYAIKDNPSAGQCDCARKSGERPMVYHAKTKQCYFTYEQSYCRSGQWLTFNTQGRAVCTKNKCLTAKKDRLRFGEESEEDLDVQNLVPYQGNGQCVKLHEPFRQCKSGEVVTFIPGRLTPQCGKEEFIITTKAISPITYVTCEPGSYISLSGKCQPSFEW